jgi:hypothetical protein
MPSPFPGMDPYLEDPELWPDVHHALISEIRALLNPLIRPKYVARVDVRVYKLDDADPARRLFRIPDVKIETASILVRPRGTRQANLKKTDESFEITTMADDDDLEEAYIKIVEVKSKNLVTHIEIVSPTNKVAGSEGRKTYAEKRSEIMASEAHFVEIDLLRRGKPFVNRSGLDCNYLAHVSRVERRPKGRVWPIRLRNRLPVIDIPLLGSDPDVRLDLQKALINAYEHGAYDSSVDYSVPAEPPLADEDAAWADALLRRAGLRRRRRRS